MRSSIRIGIVLALTVAAGTAAAAPPVFSPAPPTRPHFRAFADWAPLWWKWVLGTPVSTNPVLDPTGANCAVNQTVPGVFFLAGSFGPNSVQRTCSVPLGTALLIPLLNNAYLAQLTDPPAQRTEAFIRSQILCTEQSTSLLLEVDGVAQPNPKSLLERSSVFSVSLPADNVYAVPPQLLSPAVDAGYYSFVEPLAPGPHTIHLRARATNG